MMLVSFLGYSGLPDDFDLFWIDAGDIDLLDGECFARIRLEHGLVHFRILASADLTLEVVNMLALRSVISRCYSLR